MESRKKNDNERKSRKTDNKWLKICFRHLIFQSIFISSWNTNKYTLNKSVVHGRSCVDKRFFPFFFTFSLKNNDKTSGYTNSRDDLLILKLERTHKAITRQYCGHRILMVCATIHFTDGKKVGLGTICERALYHKIWQRICLPFRNSTVLWCFSFSEVHCDQVIACDNIITAESNNNNNKKKTFTRETR